MGPIKTSDLINDHHVNTIVVIDYQLTIGKTNQRIIRTLYDHFRGGKTVQLQVMCWQRSMLIT